MTKLRGTIPAVADALPADVLLVPADGVPSALYLVEATAPGVHRTPLVSLDMTRQLCDITLDDAPGPAGRGRRGGRGGGVARACRRARPSSPPSSSASRSAAWT